MWRIMFRWSAAVLCAAVAVGVASSLSRGWHIEWPAIVSIGGAVTGIFAIRCYLLLRRERARLLRRHVATIEAMQQLVDDMARLSAADMSIYLAAHQGANDDVAFCTGGGSPNHHVLVQMADLGLASPVKMENLGAPPHQLVLARYALTETGRAALGNLLEAVSKRRRFFAGL
jgi:hypothetical protein